MDNSITNEIPDVSTDDVEYKIVKWEDINDNPLNYEDAFVEIEERLFVYENNTEEYSKRLTVAPILELGTYRITATNDCFTIRYYADEPSEVYNSCNSISTDDETEKLVIKAYGQIKMTFDRTEWYLSPDKITFYPEISLDDITTEESSEDE